MIPEVDKSHLLEGLPARRRDSKRKFQWVRVFLFFFFSFSSISQAELFIVLFWSDN